MTVAAVHDMTVRRGTLAWLGSKATLISRAVRRSAPPNNSESATLHQRLRGETAALHGVVEAQLDLLAPDLTIDRYRHVLKILHGYWIPLEAQLASVAAATPALRVPLRLQGPLLERDLIQLGLSRAQLAELPACVELPRVVQREDIAGCLYVLEGARLGGQVIAHTVDQRLGITEERGAGFFSGDGRGTAARWKRVVGWLEGLVGAGANPDAIVGSACDTFRTLGRWADRQEGATR